MSKVVGESTLPGKKQKLVQALQDALDRAPRPS
jgi:hypothetical protein